ncbi:MAG TPA: hypothetical protein DCO89_02580 [Clostridiales bacterium]|nr:hypothetical protein [Clostridiales bacterium]
MEDNKIHKPKSPSSLSTNKSFSTSKNVKPMTNLEKTIKLPTEVTRVEKVTQATVAPRNLKRFFAILVATLLTILVAVAFVLIVINPKPIRPSDISLDFNVDTNIIISGEDLDTGRKVMPGDKIDYSFEIATSKNQDSEEVNLDVFLRIKASVIIESNYYSNVMVLTFIDENQWYKGGDGYYYLQKTDFTDGLLSPDEKIKIIRHMEIDKKLGNEFAGKPINIEFTAEVLQAQYQAIEEIWPTAPYEWATQYKELTW